MILGLSCFGSTTLRLTDVKVSCLSLLMLHLQKWSCTGIVQVSQGQLQWGFTTCPRQALSLIQRWTDLTFQMDSLICPICVLTMIVLMMMKCGHPTGGWQSHSGHKPSPWRGVHLCIINHFAAIGRGIPQEYQAKDIFQLCSDSPSWFWGCVHQSLPLMPCQIANLGTMQLNSSWMLNLWTVRSTHWHLMNTRNLINSSLKNLQTGAHPPLKIADSLTSLLH